MCFIIFDLICTNEAKYVKIVATKTYGNSTWEANKFASGKGFYLYEDTTKNQEDNIEQNQGSTNQGQDNSTKSTKPNIDNSGDKSFYEEFLINYKDYLVN